jgi:hypothetical protein
VGAHFLQSGQDLLSLLNGRSTLNYSLIIINCVDRILQVLVLLAYGYFIRLGPKVALLELGCENHISEIQFGAERVERGALGFFLGGVFWELTLGKAFPGRQVLQDDLPL